MLVGQRHKWRHAPHPPQCDRVSRRTRKGVVIEEIRCENDAAVSYDNGKKRCSNHYVHGARIAHNYVTVQQLLEAIWSNHAR